MKAAVLDGRGPASAQLQPLTLHSIFVGMFCGVLDISCILCETIEWNNFSEHTSLHAKETSTALLKHRQLFEPAFLLFWYNRTGRNMRRVAQKLASMDETTAPGSCAKGQTTYYRSLDGKRVANFRSRDGHTFSAEAPRAGLVAMSKLSSAYCQYSGATKAPPTKR